MKVAVTGASGFVGSALVPALAAAGHEVLRLVRRVPDSGDEVRWDPETGFVDAARLGGVEGVVHLAGENVATARWTDEKKRRIRDSRVGGTRVLAGALARVLPRPRVLVCASAIGFYGNRGDEVLAEDSGPGAG